MLIDKFSKSYPHLYVIKRRRKHHRVIEDDFAQLHKFIDLLYKYRDTIVWLLLSSSFKQIYVMYQIQRTFFLQKWNKNLTSYSIERFKSYFARVTNAKIKECCCLISFTKICHKSQHQELRQTKTCLEIQKLRRRCSQVSSFVLLESGSQERSRMWLLHTYDRSFCRNRYSC